MRIIGLTGGIGAGKSTVTDYLKDKGYFVIDADDISHQITEKGTDTVQKIAQCFGHDVLQQDGSLDRKKLASLVFSSREKKELLERLTTDEVVKIIKNQLDRLRRAGKYDIIFIDAPLLFETGADKLTDLVWLVDANPDVRVCRVMERDGVSREDVIGRIRNQMDSAEKRKLSQEIIDNSKGKEELYQQVEYLLMKYVKK